MSLFSLNKAEKLKSRKAIDRLFKKGQSFSAYPFRIVYYIEEPKPADSQGLKMAVTIPKKAFAKAVKRNKLKRQVREAYRLNKSPLKDLFRLKDQELQLMYIYISKKEEPYELIEKSVIKTIKSLVQRVG